MHVNVIRVILVNYVNINIVTTIVVVRVEDFVEWMAMIGNVNVLVAEVYRQIRIQYIWVWIVYQIVRRIVIMVNVLEMRRIVNNNVNVMIIILEINVRIEEEY